MASGSVLLNVDISQVYAIEQVQHVGAARVVSSGRAEPLKSCLGDCPEEVREATEEAPEKK
eukprot:263814-Lingulodinium_polyedra.AAC.1